MHQGEIECVSLEKVIKVQADGNREREGGRNGERQNWRCWEIGVTPRNTQVVKCPWPPPSQPQHELIASPASGCIIISLVWKQLKFCKQQIPWNPLTQTSFHSEDGVRATPSQSAQICFRGKQWFNCSSHTPGKKTVDFHIIFSTD